MQSTYQLLPHYSGLLWLTNDPIEKNQFFNEINSDFNDLLISYVKSDQKEAISYFQTKLFHKDFFLIIVNLSSKINSSLSNLSTLLNQINSPEKKTIAILQDKSVSESEASEVLSKLKSQYEIQIL